MSKNISTSYKHHIRWLQTIALIEQLHQLCLALRSHRGTTTAQLEGDTFFESVSRNTAQTISQLLLNVDQQQPVHDAGCKKRLIAIHQSWLQIQAQWQTETPNQNFDTHCRLITDVQQLIWALALKSSYTEEDKPQAGRYVLMHFLLQTHAQFMESLARLRGLGCLYCARGKLTRKDRKHIHKEIKAVQQQWQHWLLEFHGLPNDMQTVINKRGSTYTVKQSLNQFMAQLQGLQKPQTEIPNASEMFNHANAILNQLDSQYKIGLEQLKTCLQEPLKAWISNPPKVLLTNHYIEVADSRVY